MSCLIKVTPAKSQSQIYFSESPWSSSRGLELLLKSYIPYMRSRNTILRF